MAARHAQQQQCAKPADAVWRTAAMLQQLQPQQCCKNTGLLQQQQPSIQLQQAVQQQQWFAGSSCQQQSAVLPQQQQQQQAARKPRVHMQQKSGAQVTRLADVNIRQQQCNAHPLQQHGMEHQHQQRQQQQQQQQAPSHTRTTHLTAVACWMIWLVLLLYAGQALPAASALQHVLLPLNPGVYNPSLVVYQGSGWLVARSTQLKWDTTGLKWIINRAYLCQVDVTTWSNIRCYDFDPWRGGFGQQCRWGSAAWKVPWEAWGVDDTKLFAWPGRGLWAVTGRRPQQPPHSIYCPQPVVWKQWLVQLAQEGEPLNPKLFSFPPTEPANVTWGPKPGNGRRLKLLQFSSASRGGEASAEGLENHDSSSSSGSAAVRGSHRSRRRRRRARWRNRHNSSSDSSSSLWGGHMYHRRADQGVRRRWRIHTRLGFTLPGLQQQQQQWDHLIAPLPVSSPALDSQQVLSNAGHPQLGPLAPAMPAAAASAKQDPAAASQTATTATAGQQQQQQQQHQGAVALVPDKGSSSSGGNSSSSSSSGIDAWSSLWGKPPIPLAIVDAKAVYGKQHSINEKNWMPFVWQGKLFVTYSLAPKHRIYQLRPDGFAEPKYESDPSAVFAAVGQAASKLHGGPPLVFVNFTAMKGMLSDAAVAAATAQQGSYYLGVAHFWLPVPGSTYGRSYHHYLIKVEPRPPFRVTQLSAELPVRYSAHYKHVAFVSGLDLAVLPKQQQQQQQSPAAVKSAAAAAAGRRLKAWMPKAHASAATFAGVVGRSLSTQGMPALQQVMLNAQQGRSAAPAPAEAVAEAVVDWAQDECNLVEQGTGVNVEPALVSLQQQELHPLQDTMVHAQEQQDAAATELGGRRDEFWKELQQQQRMQQAMPMPTMLPSSEVIPRAQRAAKRPRQLTAATADQGDTAAAAAVQADTAAAAATPANTAAHTSPAVTGTHDSWPVPPVAPPLPATHARRQPTASAQQQQQQQTLLPYVLVSLGSGDWESHVLVMSLDDVERLFMAGASAPGGMRSSSSSAKVGG